MIAATAEPVSSAYLLPLEERVERLIERRRQIDLQEVLWSREAADLAASDQYMEEGFVTAQEWLRVICHLSSPQIAERVAVGEQIGSMPETLQALVDGEIGFGHVLVMAKTAQALQRSRTAQPFEEKAVLGDARVNTVGKLHYICEHLRHARDAEGYAAAEARAVEARRLEITSGGNGLVTVKGMLDSAGAAALRKALEPLARRSDRFDKRERRQRLADALVELAAGARPAQIQVTASVETLMGLAGAPAAEMEFSLPISAKTVERMACDCSVVRVLMGSDSSVLDVGQATRKISPAMRRGLIARDGGCRWPGCDRPAYWSEGHHLQHWIKGGPTELDNLVLLCYRHHRNVHEVGWQVVKSDGRLVTIPPPTRFGPWSRGPTSPD